MKKALFATPQDAEAAFAQAGLDAGERRMVRELARAEPMQRGKHPLAWDGLDMDGKPAPAGKYEWRSLQTQGLRSEYLMSVGTSVGERKIWFEAESGGGIIHGGQASRVR